MATQETNFFEITLRSLLIGLTVYNEEGTALIIDELNYDPLIKCIYIKFGLNSYKMRIDKNYNFEINSKYNKIVQTKTKITGKRIKPVKLKSKIK